MLKILILGSNSFIGGHFVRGLLARKDVDLTLFGKRKEIEFSFLKQIEGDFSNQEILKEAVTGQDIVYHFISQTIPSNSWNTPRFEIENNLLPFLNFIETASQSDVKKICFASSGGTIYGLQPEILNEDSKTDPFSPYGIIKRANESFLLYAKAKYQINYDIYRISNVYGERQNTNKGLGFVNTALENILENRPVIIYGDGEKIRDYIYAQDVSRLLTLSIEKNIKDSDIYNVSSGFSISLNSLIELMKKVLDHDFEVVYLPSRESDNDKVTLDNSKIMQYFNNFDFTTLEEGIKKNYRYLQKLNK